jgi:hypothetical protein
LDIDCHERVYVSTYEALLLWDAEKALQISQEAVL